MGADKLTADPAAHWHGKPRAARLNDLEVEALGRPCDSATPG